MNQLRLIFWYIAASVALAIVAANPLAIIGSLGWGAMGGGVQIVLFGLWGIAVFAGAAVLRAAIPK
jgi:hypothetical protein